ncbi:MAG TPA: sulfur transferase domain-containing protein [Gemmatimonadales bacterium]|nr:sulfur transferase domain-containing protein [Gemmatimonadales bacterium]
MMPTLLDAFRNLPNASEPVPGWITGGQPTESQLKAFKAAGGEVVVDNRDPMEPHGFDEPASARALGLAYINLPIVHGAVTADTMKQMHATAKKLENRKALLHCSSGNRTSAALIPYLMIEKKMDRDEAVDVAMRGGLRSAELMEVALDYALGSSLPPA